MLDLKYIKIEHGKHKGIHKESEPNGKNQSLKEFIFISSIVGQQGWQEYFKEYYPEYTIHFFEISIPKKQPTEIPNMPSEIAAQQIANLITQHKISKDLPLVAHGVGGRIATILNIQHAIGPCLIIFGTRLIHKPLLRELLWLKIKKITTSKPLLHLLMPAAYATNWQTQLLWNLRHENLSNILTQISKPTLLIWGDADTASPLVFGIEAHKKIKNSTFRVITDGDTIAPYKPVPDALKELISTFLEKCK